MPFEGLQARGIALIAIVFAAVVAVLSLLPAEDGDPDVAPPTGSYELNTTTDYLSSASLHSRVEDLIAALREGSAAERTSAADQVTRMAKDPEERDRIRALDSETVMRLSDALSLGMGHENELVRLSCQSAWHALHLMPLGPDEVPDELR